MSTHKVGVFVGSLRKESYSMKIARAFMTLVPASIEFVLVDISDLTLYNQDFDDENRPPVSWSAFREEVKGLDAFLFVTPEYNRSVPAVLKNALDVGSRPFGKSVWNDKPGAVVSVSPGALGAFGANHHLRQSLVFLNIPTMQQPEAYIGNAKGLFDPDGAIMNDSTLEFLRKFMTAFALWVEIHTDAAQPSRK